MSKSRIIKKAENLDAQDTKALTGESPARVDTSAPNPATQTVKTEEPKDPNGQPPTTTKQTDDGKQTPNSQPQTTELDAVESKLRRIEKAVAAAEKLGLVKETAAIGGLVADNTDGQSDAKTKGDSLDDSKDNSNAVDPNQVKKQDTDIRELSEKFNKLLVKSEQLLKLQKSTREKLTVAKKYLVESKNALKREIVAHESLKLSVETKLDLSKVNKMRSEGMSPSAIREYAKRTATRPTESFSKPRPNVKPLFKEESVLDSLLKGAKTV